VESVIGTSLVPYGVPSPLLSSATIQSLQKNHVPQSRNTKKRPAVTQIPGVLARFCESGATN